MVFEFVHTQSRPGWEHSSKLLQFGEIAYNILFLKKSQKEYIDLEIYATVWNKTCLSKVPV